MEPNLALLVNRIASLLMNAGEDVRLTHDAGGNYLPAFRVRRPSGEYEVSVRRLTLDSSLDSLGGGE
jgi:hypothetical protein